MQVLEGPTPITAPYWNSVFVNHRPCLCLMRKGSFFLFSGSTWRKIRGKSVFSSNTRVTLPNFSGSKFSHYPTRRAHTLARGSQENEQEISGFVSQKWHSKIFKLTGFFLFSKYFRYTFSRNVVFRYCLEFFSIRTFSSLRKKLNHATRTQVRSLTITLAFRSSVSKLISLLGEDSL